MENSALYISIIAAVILFFVLYVYIKREVLNTNGKASAKATRGILFRFGFPRGFKVLSGIALKNDGEEVVIENMLIGYFGILLVRTLGARGEYYGTIDSKSWTLVDQGKKTVIENPVKMLERDESALRAVFSKNEVYNVPVERIVYISNKSGKTAVYVTHSGEILTGGRLSGYLEKSKFEKDAGLDVKKIADVISSECITK